MTRTAIKCEYCSGRGGFQYRSDLDDTSWEPCPDCNGKGVVMATLKRRVHAYRQTTGEKPYRWLVDYPPTSSGAVPKGMLDRVMLTECEVEIIDTGGERKLGRVVGDDGTEWVDPPNDARWLYWSRDFGEFELRWADDGVASVVRGERVLHRGELGTVWLMPDGSARACLEPTDRESSGDP